MEGFIQQQMEFIGRNQNFIEQLGNEMLLISMNIFIRQQDEYLHSSAMLIDELDREMQLLISVNSIRQQEYLNIINNDNATQELRREMVENHLQTKTHVDKGEEDSDVCSICLDEFMNGSSVGVLNCGHEFHSGCVKNWLVINNVCPLCKSTGVRYD